MNDPVADHVGGQVHALNNQGSRAVRRLAKHYAPTSAASDPLGKRKTTRPSTATTSELWSAEDADFMQEVSKCVFMEIDTDNDGVISLRDVETMLRVLELPTSVQPWQAKLEAWKIRKKEVSRFLLRDVLEVLQFVFGQQAPDLVKKRPPATAGRPRSPISRPVRWKATSRYNQRLLRPTSPATPRSEQDVSDTEHDDALLNSLIRLNGSAAQPARKHDANSESKFASADKEPAPQSTQPLSQRRSRPDLSISLSALQPPQPSAEPHRASDVTSAVQSELRRQGPYAHGTKQSEHADMLMKTAPAVYNARSVSFAAPGRLSVALGEGMLHSFKRL